MSELFLFVRPPRPLWPFNGPSSAFWPPLAFASMAAALREANPKIRVAILDAPALRMGWRSLTGEMARLRPAYVGIGEEAVSYVEGLRVAGVARLVGARVIAGGCFFSHVAPECLRSGAADVVVHGEGEQTLVELVEAMQSGSMRDLRRVTGISFRDHEEVVFTGWREPIADLDQLPFPAYDLLPVERYGADSRNHPALAAIELGRGCRHACSFCVLWRQMGRFRGNQPAPCLRSKSAERLREEIRILVSRWGRRYLGWVDPCFNADAEVPRQLGELLLRDGCRIGQSAWLRTDHLLRDAESGALRTCVAAGLNELYLGIERTRAEDLRALNKCNGHAAQALRVLAKEFPEVTTVGSFIYGLPGETPEKVRRLVRQAYDLPLDLVFFIPLTPLPGTPYWRPEMWDPTGRKFRQCDFLPHVNGNPEMAKATAALYREATLFWSVERARQLASGLLAGDARRRSVVRRHMGRIMPFVTRGFLASLLGRNRAGMRIPEWYEE